MFRNSRVKVGQAMGVWIEDTALTMAFGLLVYQIHRLDVNDERLHIIFGDL